MPERSFNADAYRYGSNAGSEKDDEITGVVGSMTTADYWELDTRLGRRWNTDQVVKPWESPYATFGDNPIYYNDPFGLDKGTATKKEKDKGAKDSKGTGYSKDGNTRSNGDSKQTLDPGCDCYVNSETPSSSGGNSSALVAPGIATSTQASREFATKVINGLEKEFAAKGAPKVGGGVFGLVGTLATMSLTMSGNNPTAQEARQIATKTVNSLLAKGQLDEVQNYADNYNRKYQDQIVFRYLSFMELNSALVSNGGNPLLQNLNSGGLFSEKYVTPDIYGSSNVAKSKLALPTAPDVIIWTFKNSIRATLKPGVGWDPVRPKYGEPGGGRQGTINQTFPVMGGFILPK